MTDTRAELAAAIERRSAEAGAKIEELLRQQTTAQARVTQLQRELRDGDDQAKQTSLAELKEARDAAGRLIGLLARHRVELLDNLPTIVDAAGQLDVLANQLSEDAGEIERITKRLKKLTSTINKAEGVIVKIISLVKRVVV
ncbi:MAG: hypothetical protein QNJ67_21385 [Kiloniellales bacterium]|nr:hypothetical protein [Kiloniellales bacterium]